jgi:ssDNA-binding replication factor A large subunit
VVSAYVKQGLDGKPNLNLGKRGRIEAITDSSISSKLASLSALSKNVDMVQEGETVFAVDGLASTDSRRTTFIRRDDGSSGSLTQFELKGSGDKTTRVVIWDGVDLPEVKSGSKIRVTNLRQKKGRQGEAELHGDGATVIQMLGDGDLVKDHEVVHVLNLVKVGDVTKHAVSGVVDLEVMALSKGSVRDVNLKDGSIAKKGEVVLGDDTGEITVVAWDETSKVIGEIQTGERLRVQGAAIQVSKMGAETLELSRLSKVERLRGRG